MKMCFLNQAETCPICLSTLSNIYTTDCGHQFCRPCIFSWMYQAESCPVCRDLLPSLKIFSVRRATFNGWKRGQDLDVMAENGFYVINNKKELVKCIYCGLELIDWKPEDDPWLEHARCYQFCRRVLFHSLCER